MKTEFTVRQRIKLWTTVIDYSAVGEGGQGSSRRGDLKWSGTLFCFDYIGCKLNAYWEEVYSCLQVLKFMVKWILVEICFVEMWYSVDNAFHHYCPFLSEWSTVKFMSWKEWWEWIWDVVEHACNCNTSTWTSNIKRASKPNH